ncbi:hypothetical protein LBMAG42_49900 [Deltaproteobacteria bacterium]|nr:hypothetical protein LBMAG42_49900 [Deltaproteobacteria bacterium]
MVLGPAGAGRPRLVSQRHSAATAYPVTRLSSALDNVRQQAEAERQDPRIPRWLAATAIHSGAGAARGGEGLLEHALPPAERRKHGETHDRAAAPPRVAPVAAAEEHDEEREQPAGDDGGAQGAGDRAAALGVAAWSGSGGIGAAVGFAAAF